MRDENTIPNPEEWFASNSYYSIPITTAPTDGNEIISIASQILRDSNTDTADKNLEIEFFRENKHETLILVLVGIRWHRGNCFNFNCQIHDHKFDYADLYGSTQNGTKIYFRFRNDRTDTTGELRYSRNGPMLDEGDPTNVQLFNLSLREEE